MREYKPRLSIEISEEQNRALAQYIPPNLKSPVIRAMLDTLIHLLREYPNAQTKVLALIISKELNLAQATLDISERVAERR